MGSDTNSASVTVLVDGSVYALAGEVRNTEEDGAYAGVLNASFSTADGSAYTVTLDYDASNPMPIPKGAIDGSSSTTTETLGGVWEDTKYPTLYSLNASVASRSQAQYSFDANLDLGDLFRGGRASPLELASSLSHAEMELGRSLQHRSTSSVPDAIHFDFRFTRAEAEEQLEDALEAAVQSLNWLGVDFTPSGVVEPLLDATTFGIDLLAFEANVTFDEGKVATVASLTINEAAIGPHLSEQKRTHLRECTAWRGVNPIHAGTVRVCASPRSTLPSHTSHIGHVRAVRSTRR